MPSISRAWAWHAVSSHHGLTSSRRPSGIVPFLKPRRVIRPFRKRYLDSMSLSDRHLSNLWHVYLSRAWDWTVIFLLYQLRLYFNCFTWAHDSRDIDIVCSHLTLINVVFNMYWAVQSHTCIAIAIYYVLTHAYVHIDGIPGCVTAERHFCMYSRHVYFAYSDTNHYYLRDFLHLNNVNFITQSSLNSHRASQRLSISVK